MSSVLYIANYLHISVPMSNYFNWKTLRNEKCSEFVLNGPTHAHTAYWVVDSTETIESKECHGSQKTALAFFFLALMETVLLKHTHTAKALMQATLISVNANQFHVNNVVCRAWYIRIAKVNTSYTINMEKTLLSGLWWTVFYADFSSYDAF